MTRNIIRLLLACVMSGIPYISHAHAFQTVFDEHPSVMLLIDAKNGKIVDANRAASRFYGYTEATLEKKTISQINTLSPEQVKAEIALAKSEERRYFIFRHQLANGKKRKVKVNTMPVNLDGEALLLSIIQDISDTMRNREENNHYQNRLESLIDEQKQQLEKITRQQHMAFAIIMGLSLLFGILVYRYLAKQRLAKHVRISQCELCDPLMSHVSDGVIVTDDHYRIIKYNETARLLFEQALDESPLQPIHALFVNEADYSTLCNHQAHKHQIITYQASAHHQFTGKTNIAVTGDANSANHYLFVIHPIHIE